MALPLALMLGALAVSVPSAASFAGPAAALLRFVGVIIMGFGMADLAEAKGHSRNHGWWALLFLIGLLVVVVLPDLYRERREYVANAYWPLPGPSGTTEAPPQDQQASENKSPIGG